MYYYLALFLTQALFGLNFVASKYIIDQIPTSLYVFYRFLITTIVVWLFSPFFWSQRPKFTWKFVSSALFFSLLGYGGTQFLIIFGLSLTSPTNAAIITSLIPIFTLLILTITGQDDLTLGKSMGFILALIGVGWTLNWEGVKLSWETMQGDVLVFLGALSASVFLVYSKSFYKQASPYWSAATLFFWATVITSPALLITNWPDSFTWTHQFTLAFIYAVIGATLIAYMLVNWLIPIIGAEKTSLFAYIQPIIAALGAMYFLGHPLENKHIVATILVFFGFILAIRKPKKLDPSN